MDIRIGKNHHLWYLPLCFALGFFLGSFKKGTVKMLFYERYKNDIIMTFRNESDMLVYIPDPEIRGRYVPSNCLTYCNDTLTIHFKARPDVKDIGVNDGPVEIIMPRYNDILLKPGQSTSITCHLDTSFTHIKFKTFCFLYEDIRIYH